MNQPLIDYIEDVSEEFASIPERRREKLREVVKFIRRSDPDPARITFICTHNSRRSLLCQVWAAAAARHYGISGVETYSGGTEATAFHPNAVAALRRAGFTVERQGNGENPSHLIRYDQDACPLNCFSKPYDDPHNPAEHFAAVMTCATADRECPAIPGAALRVSLPYEDPKTADGTPAAELVYDERCRQIAREMCWMLKSV